MLLCWTQITECEFSVRNCSAHDFGGKISETWIKVNKPWSNKGWNYHSSSLFPIEMLQAETQFWKKRGIEITKKSYSIAPKAMIMCCRGVQWETCLHQSLASWTLVELTRGGLRKQGKLRARGFSRTLSMQTTQPCKINHKYFNLKSRSHPPRG